MNTLTIMSYVLGDSFIPVSDGLVDEVLLILHALQLLQQLGILLLQLDVLQQEDKITKN